MAALITGIWFLLVLGVHLFMGGPAALKHRPEPADLHRLWLMKLGAFHLITVDLAVLGAGLVYLALVFPAAQSVYQGIAALCLLYALVWLSQVLRWGKTSRAVLEQGQWMLFLIAALGSFVAGQLA
ncbi:hypothetical protein [Deinococcus roseus]|uniref:hypothetical protein n=1 Tax=Deinococcus roseus TaxID=392414 RepID=UPI0016657805|nr:hypothetical protein [Deinococcus roseus]